MRHGHRSDTFLAADEAHAFICGCLDADMVGWDAESGADVRAHRVAVRQDFRGLCDVANFPDYFCGSWVKENGFSSLEYSLHQFHQLSVAIHHLIPDLFTRDLRKELTGAFDLGCLDLGETCWTDSFILNFKPVYPGAVPDLLYVSWHDETYFRFL
jgi:hypothetical protein